MEDLINGIARLFGILYRTIFQLIPSGLLIVVSFLLINRLHPNEVDQFVEYFNNLQTYQIVFLGFITLYTFNTIIDSLTEFVISRIFEFGHESKLRLTLPRSYGDIIERMQCKYVEKTGYFSKEELKKMDELQKDERGNVVQQISKPNRIDLESSMYDFAVTDSLKFHKDIYNYIQYREGLLDLFSNTFIVLIVISLTLVPYYIFRQFQICLPLLTIFQILAIPTLSIVCLLTLERVNRKGTGIAKKKNGRLRKLFGDYKYIFILAIIGMMLLASYIQIFSDFTFCKENWLYGSWILFIVDFLFVPIFYVLLMTSFRNYMFVDRACVSYQLLRNFGHDFFKEPVNPKE